MPSFATLYALQQLPLSALAEEVEEGRKTGEKSENEKIPGNSGRNSAEDPTTQEALASALEHPPTETAPYMFLDGTRRAQLLYQEEHRNPFYPDPMHRDMIQLTGNVTISSTRQDLVRSHLSTKLNAIDEAVQLHAPIPTRRTPSPVKKEEGPVQPEERPVSVKASLDELEGTLSYFL